MKWVTRGCGQLLLNKSIRTAQKICSPNVSEWILNSMSRCFCFGCYGSCSMLMGFLATTTCRVFRQRMEKSTSRCSKYLRLCWISNRRQPIKGGFQAWGVGRGPNRSSCYGILHRASELERFFVTILETKNIYNIWILDVSTLYK
jgi:hypothetical protein